MENLRILYWLALIGRALETSAAYNYRHPCGRAALAAYKLQRDPARRV
jgi:hypothetical protein